MFTRYFAQVLVAASVSLPLIAASQTSGSDVSPTAPSSPSKSSKQTARRTSERIYGSQMMTPEERTAYHDKMRAAKTAEERERIRAEHHKEMQARAKERGVTLPDMPGPRTRRGSHMGPGMGMGPSGEPGAAPGAGAAR